MEQYTPEMYNAKRCPKCGSSKIEIELFISEEFTMRETIKGKTNKMSGKKKPCQEFQHGADFSKKLGKYVNKDRVIDRKNDNYYEKVVDPDTGEVLHKCQEALSKHIGHGSAKEKRVD